MDSSAILHLAHLARLGLSTEEAQIYATQTNDILAFFKKIEEVNTDGITPMAPITGLINRERSDTIDTFGEEKHILQCSPNGSEHGFIKVQKAL